MKTKLKLAVLISGRGSNLKSLIEKSTNYEIIAVLSNRSDALGLNFAKEAGINCRVFERENFKNLAQQKKAILDELIKLKPDLIALAGFMLILDQAFIDAFPARIVNIHPSLLPKFPGLDTHKRALAAHEKTHGCSVHIVDAGVDSGALLAQASLQILPDETEESLSKRVLALEHAIYPWTIQQIAFGEIQLNSKDPKISSKAFAEGIDKGFKIHCKECS